MFIESEHTSKARKIMKVANRELKISVNGISLFFPTDLLKSSTIKEIKRIAEEAEGSFGDDHKALVRMEQRCNLDLDLYRNCSHDRSGCIEEYNKNILASAITYND